ncbi:MAG TPA: dihydrolipoamide acetyltransferase family protein [Bacteroidota bacterium]|nr:dihydrolipoamide acetyltransferase family protein [Bacteroidota bacterium]
MATEIKMPKLGMTMEEGKLLEWARKEKNLVKKGEVLLTIESDKVTFEVESPGDGLLLILVAGGEGIPVGEILAYLADSEEEYARIRSAGRAAAPAEPTGERAAPGLSPGAPAAREGAVRATPAAREAARQKGVDLSTIAGTGPQGRITREDVLAALEKGPIAVSPPARPTPAAACANAKGGRKELDREEPMSGMRTAISRNMMESLRNSAQMTAFSEWDVSELLRLRALINEGETRNGFKATVPGMMVALLARVLKEMPVFNASVEGGKVLYWRNVNIGVAVAVPEGLVVPVLHDADRMSLAEVHRGLADLVERARQKKLLPEEISGGTFTLTNLGSYGGEWETVIINPPEVAILGIGKASKKPVVDGDRIVVRKRMPVSLTVDHRLIDGETSGRFRRRMRELVENPGLLWDRTSP